MNVLQPEIISLIHHVKLNESGWWEKVIRNLIISIFGLRNNSPLKVSDLPILLKQELNIDVDLSRLESHFYLMKGDRTVIEKIDDKDYFVLSDSAYEEFKNRYAEQIDLEESAKKKFIELSNNLCPNVNAIDLWSDLNTNFIIPLIKEIGARTYELVSGKINIDFKEYEQFQNFSKKYNDEEDLVQKVVIVFFDFREELSRKYILRKLSAYFFVEATNLDKKTVEEIYQYSNLQKNLRVFIDTNFLLTMLDLHDNPSNEATNILIDLLNQINNKVSVKFYITLITINEFQNLISKFKSSLKNIPLSINYSQAISESSELSGIYKKYFQKCLLKGTSISVDEYFEPYLENVVLFLRTKGIEFFNENLETYDNSQKVLDDIIDQVEYRMNLPKNIEKQKGLSPDGIKNIKNKLYDKFAHDCILWHLVNDKRPSYIDSIKDVKDWIITLDFGFLEFDKYKQLKNPNLKISVCIHPNELISMLQFWVPRNETFEQAILGNFKLPFLFKEIDIESEKISIEILGALSHYDGNESFSKEFLTEVLANKALRQKIKTSNSITENAELIKEEIFKLYEIRKLELEKEKSDNIELKKDIRDLGNKFQDFIDETKQSMIKILSLQRENKIREGINNLEKLKIELELNKSRLQDFEKLKTNVQKDVNEYSEKLSVKIKSIFKKKKLILKSYEESIIKKYYDNKEYLGIKDRIIKLEYEINNFNIPNIKDKIIIHCENKNEKIFNSLGFEDIYFNPQCNASDVFYHTKANPFQFGLRDRDYLSDNEISKIKSKYQNYFILDYYCFENYLYHPDNLEELDLNGFDKQEYLFEMIKQKNEKIHVILTKLVSSRNSYQELKSTEEGVKDKNENEIINNLKSDHLEVFLKSFDLKNSFAKDCLEKYNLNIELLTSTKWFRTEIQKVLTSVNKLKRL